jgi:histidine phosphotransfer protein HptB
VHFEVDPGAGPTHACHVYCLLMPTTSSLPSAPTEASAAAPLRADALAVLRSLDPAGGSMFVVRVLRTYLGSLDRYLPEIRAARERGDAAALRMVVHSLKSSSLQIGAEAFGQLCADTEQRLVAQGLDSPGLDERLAQLTADAQGVRLRVESTLDAEAAR